MQKTKTNSILSRVESWAESVLAAGLILAGLGAFGIVMASSSPVFNQTINAGSLSVDMVDGSLATVASPSVSFSAYDYSFSVGTTTGTLGAPSEQILITNGTANANWSLTFAPTGTQAVWFANGNTYDYKSADHSTGTMQIDPSVGTLAGVSSCATTNVNKGSAAYFSPTQESITLLTASGAAIGCRWTLQSVAVNQQIPSGQVGGNYQIGMVLTVN